MLIVAVLIVILASVSQLSAVSTNELPSFLPRCYIDDPKMNECLLNAAITLKPYIRGGIEAIGIPPYDPLIIPNFNATQETDMMNYSTSLSNYTIRGMDNYDITEIRYDPKTMIFNGKIAFDPLDIHTTYIFEGRMLFIPLSGNGIFRVALGPINGTFEIAGNMTTVENRSHYNPTSVQVRLKIDDMSIKFDGLFGENVELATRTNKIVNQYSKMIVGAATPTFEGLVEFFLMRYVQWLTKTFPYYQLFPRST